MRGVAGEEHAPDSISVRHQIARHPAQHRHHLMRHRLSHHAGDQRRGIHARGIVEIVFAAQPEPPQLAAVELDERAPNPLRVGEEMQRGLALVVMGPQLRRAEEDVEIVFERRRALHLDAQCLGDRAVSAAAGDEIVGRIRWRSPVARSCTVAITPSSSCSNDSNRQRSRSVTLGKLAARSRRIGSSQS